ncbi:sodium:solute symporter family protein [Nonomuraea sp. NEAU-A123]|uniref:sodium:solute symporter family protein n=1 Tax=Nonomuraea sp. NEAU-A123 TaxID=2839649 RepID=UPI001BE42190|nr:sodium:solute symporter family protein [Nonomuraea sp. NEAU-A123]
MIVSLALMALTLGVAVYLGIRARGRSAMSLERWAVGGRSLGGVFVFLLMAGEIYTTTTFLGISGFIYGNGGAAYYILAYVTLAYVVSYWLLPVLWRYAKEHGLVSQADFFIKKYNSRGLGVVVTVIGVAGMVPFLVLQLKGLGIIVAEASYGAVPSSVAIVIGGVLLTGYVTLSGLFAAAWTSVVKDILIVIVVGFLGIYLPLRYFGSVGDLFAAVEAARPHFAALHTDNLGVSWYISTVVVSTLGFYMWPHLFAATFSARKESTFRKNAVVFPLYQLFLLFVFFVGFAAVLAVPGLSAGQADLSLLRLAKESLPPVVIGLVGGGGLLAALVPGAMLLNTTSALIANNVYKPLRPGADIGRVARLMVPCVGVVTIYLALNDGAAIVTLLLLAYALVTQLAPALLLSLLPKNPANSWGAGAGMLAGTGAIAYLTVNGLTVADVAPFLSPVLLHLNVGVLALVLNLTVLALVTLATSRRAPALSPEGTA